MVCLWWLRPQRRERDVGNSISLQLEVSDLGDNSPSLDGYGLISKKWYELLAPYFNAMHCQFMQMLFLQAFPLLGVSLAPVSLITRLRVYPWDASRYT